MHIHLYPTLNITISSIEITKKTAESIIADGPQVGILAHESMAHESMLSPELQVCMLAHEGLLAPELQVEV